MSGYNSFYGGRRGASFVIVEKYASIKEMISYFQQGGSYKTVNYDEYVLIDTVNKNDADNGKIYRRGYDYTDDLGGAIYIGQIVGPAGMAPHTELTTIAEVETLAEEEGFEYRRGSGSYAPTENLVPGKYEDEDGNIQYNDSIQWAYCSVRDENSHESTAHVGFIFPYTVIDYTAKSVNPYYNRSNDTNDFVNEDLIERTDDESHPYYESWHVSVPKGIKGDAFKNFRVTTVAECEEEHPGWLQAYDGEDDDSNNNRQILVYDYYHYDKEEGGEPVSLFLGDYNQIDSMTVNEYGTVVIEYSHDDTDTYKNLFKWIKSVSLDESTGHFIIEYNYDKTRDGEDLAKEDTTLDLYLTWIKDMTFDEDGTVKWVYTTSEDDVTKENFIKWIKTVSLDVENGQFDVEFNYPTEPSYKDNAGEATHYTTSLQWVKDISFADDGTVTIDYTNKDDTVHTNLIKWITSTSLNAETGLFEIDFNYPNEEDGTATHYEQSLTWVKDILIDEYGTLTFKYTDQDDKVLQNYVKWIKDIQYTAETGEFIVNFNYDKTRDGEDLAKEDTQYVTYLRYVDNIVIDDDGTIHFEYTYGDEQTFDQYLKKINSLTLDVTNGHFEVVYNTIDEDGNNDKYEADLTWVKDLVLTDDGTITMKYTNQDDTVYKNFIKTIKTLTLNKETGLFEVTYNYDTNEDGTATAYSQSLTWVKDLVLDSVGTITMQYTDRADKTYENYIKSIKSINLDAETGEFKIDFNYDYEADGTPTEYTTNLNWVKDIKVADNGTVTLDYTVDDNKVYENYLKILKSISLDSETGHFIATYNTTDTTGANDTYEADLTWVKALSIDESGNITVKYTNQDDVVYENYIKSIKDVTLDAETGDFTVTYNYDTNEDGTATKYTTSLTWVKNILLDDNGNITMQYTNQDDKVYPNFIKSISSTSLDTETGHFEVVYNTVDDSGENIKYETDLTWVKDLTLDGEGNITLKYTNQDDKTYTNYVKSITSASLDTTNGHFEIVYNYPDDSGNPTTYSTDLEWVSGLSIDSTGTIKVQYVTGREETLESEAKFITGITLDSEGTLTVNYNSGTSDVFEKALTSITDISLTDEGVFTVTYNNDTPAYTTTIKWPSSLSIDTGDTEGEGTQKIQVTYTDGTSEAIGNPINYIMKTACSSETGYHLYILYSDPAKRAEGPNVTYDGRADWIDLGFMGTGNVGCVAATESDTTAQTLINDLPAYSAWLIIEEDTTSDSSSTTEG